MRLFDGPIELLRQATVYSARRHELLAQNVANADTPGFQARDLSFASEMSLAQQVRALPATALGAPDLDLRLIEHPDPSVSPDGNSVDIDHQMARVARNTLYHTTVLQLLNSHFRALRTAINGHA
jgi:flagellar basal-body rod protein FlgB